MRLLRGRRQTPAADRAITRALPQRVRAHEERILRVWQPHRQVVFGRRDPQREGYETATDHLAAREIPSFVRDAGGHAVYYTGTTVSVVLARPVNDPRSGVTERYETLIGELQTALSALGVETTCEEPAGAFCPGTHSLSASGKIVGVAQRVHRDVALLGAIVIVSDHEEIADVLGEIYPLLGLTFEGSSTGSIARAGGDQTPETVIRTIERELTDGRPTVERVRET